MSTAVKLGLGFVLALTIFTVCASYTFLVGTSMLHRMDFEYLQWWLWLRYDGPNADFAARWIKYSAGAGMAPIALCGIAFVRAKSRLGPSLRGWSNGLLSRKPKVIRGVTDNHGHAAWLSMEDVARAFDGPAPGYGGVVVGEAYRPDEDPERGGTAPLLIDRCADGPTHSLLFAGSGGYKSVCATSTMLHWTGAAVVLDPSCELGPMLARDRRAMGHAVHQLSIDTAHECGVNVLDWIDTSSPTAGMDVRAVVAWIFGERASRGGNGSSTDQIFRDWAKSLVTCLLCHMLWDESIPTEEKTLRRVRRGVVSPEPMMRAVLRGIHEHSQSTIARDLAGTLMGIVDETFSGLYANATEETAWLSIPAYADLVSGSTFRTMDITKGATTVFIQIPLKALMTTPALGRVLIGSLLNAAYEAEGRVKGRILFLLDEVAQLGNMRVLQQAAATARKHNITIQMLYQSTSQMLTQWGPDGKREWENNCSWRGYASIQDLETAKEVSDSLGSYAALASSEGWSTGASGKVFDRGSQSIGSNRSVHEIKRLLMQPSELMADVRDDELFVIRRGTKPIRTGRALYFRRPEMAARVDSNRFYKERDGERK